MNNNEEQIHRLRSMIDASERMVVFTGAGISTESGIPDFRSPGGIWSKNRPIDFGEFISSEETRRESWRRKFNLDPTLRKARPNAGHRAIAQWVESGSISCVITQNIDGLHQASGVPDDRVIEIHGNTTYATCLDCAQRYELEPIRAQFEIDEALPLCTRCNGIIKTATISFGQAMPEQAMILAQEESCACDLFMAIGSSLVVYPAAGLPLLAQRAGASLVILNRDPTEQDVVADLAGPAARLINENGSFRRASPVQLYSRGLP
jgi:NAD-dependent deacetylase